MSNVHTKDGFVSCARITDDSLTHKSHKPHKSPLESSLLLPGTSAASRFPSRSRETWSRFDSYDIYVSDPLLPFVISPALLNRICSGKIEQ